MMTPKPTADALALEFVDLIRQELQRREMSVSALARLIGVSQSTADRVLNRPGAIKTETITRWFAALNMRPELKAKRQ